MSSDKREKEKDFLKRRDAMLKEVRDLSAKYHIDIVGALDFRHTGVIPLVAFVDATDKYGAVAEEPEKPESSLIT